MERVLDGLLEPPQRRRRVLAHVAVVLERKVAHCVACGDLQRRVLREDERALRGPVVAVDEPHERRHVLHACVHALAEERAHRVRGVADEHQPVVEMVRAAADGPEVAHEVPVPVAEPVAHERHGVGERGRHERLDFVVRVELVEAVAAAHERHEQRARERAVRVRQGDEHERPTRPNMQEVLGKRPPRLALRACDRRH
eukprot:Amastigsp_a178930_71.p2 type:complete len:199 gc:universal Amastigsp_a178930_71:1244-648(-)